MSALIPCNFLKQLTDPWGATKASESLLYTPLLCALDKMPASEKQECLWKKPNPSCQLQRGSYCMPWGTTFTQGKFP